MFQPHPDVLFREIEGESVLLDLGSGTYFGLDQVGTRIWLLIQQGLDQPSIVRALASEYDAAETAIAADVKRLIGELEASRLIVRTEGDGA